MNNNNPDIILQLFKTQRKIAGNHAKRNKDDARIVGPKACAVDRIGRTRLMDAMERLEEQNTTHVFSSQKQVSSFKN